MPYKDTSWKFIVTGYNQSVPKARQREVVEGFSYMALEGRIDLTNPELELWCFEECAWRPVLRLDSIDGCYWLI
jgi:tRNA (guanine10-N2)-methyltransferase